MRGAVLRERRELRRIVRAVDVHGWTAYYCVRMHPAFASIYYPVIFTPVALALAVTAGRAA